MSLNAKMTAIADSIRAKTGKTASLTLDQMVTEIEGITGGTEMFAAIGVTYSAGSTLTCTNVETGEILTANPKTEGNTQWVFAIPEVGTWTVKAGEKSVNVSITKEGQFETVNLASLVLFENGVLNSEYVLSKGTVSDGVINAAKSSNDRAIAFETPVDVTEFSTLTVEFGEISGGSFFTFGLRDTYTTGYDGYKGEGYAAYIGGNVSPKDFSETTHVLEIPSITGDKYVKLSAYQTSTCQIKRIIFE